MFKALLLVLLIPAISNAYTVIQTTTSTPAGTEQSLIAQTTTYYNATVFTDPLFANTNIITLYGPVISQFQIIKDSGTYAFIFGQGMLTERGQDIGTIAGPDSNCDASPYCQNMSSITTPSNFRTYASTYTVTIDSGTCQAIVCRIAADIYQQNYSPILINSP